MSHDDKVNDYYRGVFAERERIIELLEAYECACDHDDCDGWAIGDIEPLIALIKGELND